MFLAGVIALNVLLFAIPLRAHVDHSRRSGPDTGAAGGPDRRWVISGFVGLLAGLDGQAPALRPLCRCSVPVRVGYGLDVPPVVRI